MVKSEQLFYVYKGGKTKRFHAADTLTTQTVGEHSFGVAWTVHMLHPEARKELILAALAHDLAEHQVGDVSSVAKRAYPALKLAVDVTEADCLRSAGLSYEELLTEEERRILKVADLVDGLMFCLRERSMGSRVVIPIYRNFYHYLVTEVELDDVAINLIEDINLQWREVNASK